MYLIPHHLVEDETGTIARRLAQGRETPFHEHLSIRDMSSALDFIG